MTDELASYPKTNAGIIKLAAAIDVYQVLCLISPERQKSAKELLYRIVPVDEIVTVDGGLRLFYLS